MGFGGEIGWFYAAKSETFAERSAKQGDFGERGELQPEEIEKELF